MDGSVTAPAVLGPPVVVDAHVHIHSCFDLGEFLDSAARNFQQATRQLEERRGATGVLMLTESSGVDVFARLQRADPELLAELGSWSLAPSHESRALFLKKPGEIPLILVSGRQIRTRTGLEILALGTRRTFEDGGAFQETLKEVQRSDALPVIPWGFGKWTLRRRRILLGALGSQTTDSICLADTGGRWRRMPESRILARARASGINVLAGSDPLPTAAQVNRPGASGSILDSTLQPEELVATLLRLLRSTPLSSTNYLHSESPRVFLRNQILMQTRKRLALREVDQNGA